MWNEQEVRELEEAAAVNNGRCDRCGRVIKIYRYKLNATMANFLRRMAEEVKTTDNNDVDIAAIGLTYSQRSQVSKLRLHGLIARVKGENGKQVPGHWLITKKGWDWVSRGVAIASKVVVFENQVLGHDEETITIQEALGEPGLPQETPISEPEAQTYSQVRGPLLNHAFMAVYQGQRAGRLEPGEQYEIEIEKLQVGKPVVMARPETRTYRDIAAFQKDWKITRKAE